MNNRNRESVIEKIKRIPVIAMLFAAVAVFIPLVILLLTGTEFSDLLIPLLAGLVLLMIAAVFILMAAGKATEPLQQDFLNLKNSMASLVLGNLSHGLQTNCEELAQVEDDVIKLSENLKQVISGVKGLSQSKSLDSRIFTGEFKDVSTALTDLVNGFSNREKAAHDNEQAAVNTMLADLKTVAGNLNANRRSQRVSPGLYPAEWKPVAENLKKYVDDAENLLIGKSEEIAQLTRQIDSLKRDVDNLNNSLSAAQRTYSTPTHSTPARTLPSANLGQQRPAPPPLRNTVSPLARQLPVTKPSAGAIGTFKPRATGASTAAGSVKSANRAQAPQIKSVKIAAPSGAHEYDKKDFGKY